MSVSKLTVKIKLKWWYSTLLKIAGFTRSDRLTVWVFDTFWKRGVSIK